jgi:indolepyruvate ferredoxin oxidoreductase beta subunit
MKCDIVLAGVGGQGVLSVAAIIANAALEEGLHVKQSEVHGMAQRGGAVSAHLRIADHPIHSDLVGRGTADLILSVEPLEAFRYFDLLSPDGAVVSATEPFKNIDDYPDAAAVLACLRALPRCVLADAERLARDAGLARAANVVLVGAASRLLPLSPETIEAYLRTAFARKGAQVVEANLRAFRAGRAAAEGAGAGAVAAAGVDKGGAAC